MDRKWICVPVNGQAWEVGDPMECGFESCYEDPESGRCIEISRYIRAGRVELPDVTQLVAFLDQQIGSDR